MHKQKRFFSILVAVLMITAMMISSCSTAASEEKTEESAAVSETGEEEKADTGTQPGNYENATREETVYFDAYVAHADHANWNPFITDNLRDVGLQQALIEPLFMLNYDTGKIDSWLGLSMEPNESFDVWTLKLRPGVKWSDGEDFNADDVVFTVNMFLAKAPDLGADVATWTASVEKIDDLTVQFNLKEPNPRYQLDVWSFKIWGDRNSIVPEHIWKDYVDNPLGFTNYDPEKGWPVFTGPYVLSKFTENEYIYVRNDDWWGVAAGFQDLPAPKRLIWIQYGTEESKAAAMINNDLDAMANTSLGTFESMVAENPNIIGWESGLPYGTIDPCPRYLSINNQHPIWSDGNLRKAVNLAIDRDQIVSIAYEGGTSASISIFPQYGSMDQYNSALEEAGLAAPKTADVEAAKALIESSGWALNDDGFYEKDGQVLTMSILTIEESMETRRIGDVVAEQLRNIGIDSQPQVLSFGAWLSAQGEDDNPDDDFEAAVSFLCGGVNEPYVTLNTFAGGADAVKGGMERWSGANWEAFRSSVAELKNLAPGDPAGVPIVVDAYEYIAEDMPFVTLTQASMLTPINTTYWTNWPTSENPYTIPSTWVQSTHLIIHNLQPVEQ
ncbi:MAG: ABC transporter substrate-binding protein [Pelolinea sp.]|jgi:peptide/nickel transport system substrate-binding protein|nr:ABC transporter substrate-binding protein [Pelolinea sp.]